MAGSFAHCQDDDGQFRFDLIENMGDAHEACEEMYWIVCYLCAGSQSTLAAAHAAYVAAPAKRDGTWGSEIPSEILLPDVERENEGHGQ